MTKQISDEELVRAEEKFRRVTREYRERAARDPWAIDDRPLEIRGSGGRIVMSNYAEARMAATEILEEAEKEGSAYPGQAGMAATILAVITDINTMVTAVSYAFDGLESPGVVFSGTGPITEAERQFFEQEEKDDG